MARLRRPSVDGTTGKRWFVVGRRLAAATLFLATTLTAFATYLPGGPRVCRDELAATGSVVSVCQPAGLADVVVVGLVLLLAVLCLLPDISEFGIAGILSMKLRRRISVAEHKAEDAQAALGQVAQAQSQSERALDRLESELAEVKAEAFVMQSLKSATRVPKRDLVEALRAAPLRTRWNALDRATMHRRRTYARALTFPVDDGRRHTFLVNMARCVPVLRALAEMNWSNVPDATIPIRIHAQLGYCLKDMEKPRLAAWIWKRAVVELTTAIQLRDRTGLKDSLLELNRAKCLIAWRPEVVTPILADLEAVIRDGSYARDVAAHAGPIWLWLKQHRDDTLVSAWLLEHDRDI